MEDLDRLVGVGLYSIQDASRITGVGPNRIRGWLRGYAYRATDGHRSRSSPVLPTVLEIDDEFVLTFRDLLEVRFVDAFRRHGVSWGTIRAGAAKAQELFNSTHPFSAEKFRTDGAKIFVDLRHRGGEATLMDLLRDQQTIRQVVEPRLLDASVDFERGVPRRWFPLGKKAHVMLDPQHSFGKPIENRCYIATEVLAAAYAAEESIERVARWFDIRPASVRAAVAYERSLELAVA